MGLFAVLSFSMISVNAAGDKGSGGSDEKSTPSSNVPDASADAAQIEKLLNEIDQNRDGDKFDTLLRYRALFELVNQNPSATGDPRLKKRLAHAADERKRCSIRSVARMKAAPRPSHRCLTRG